MPPTREPAQASPARGTKKSGDGDATRETVESVVVAFILAFLFRTFEAEAFVIPTGSMAPTLYGQHRDVFCKKCGVRFASGASDELRTGFVIEGDRTHSAYCPNCRFPNFVYKDEIFTGDRILVSKFPYDFWDPKPWDVVVFKFPEEPKTNYIKRLVGLPGQEVTIVDGDVLVRPVNSSKPWQILRMEPDKQRDLQLVVYDDNHPPLDLLATGWPERWEPDANTQWTRSDPKQRAIRVDPSPAAGDDLQWLRYYHYVPDAEAWEAVRASRSIVNRPAPLLITDFCGYNARVTVQQARSEFSPEGQWPSEGDRLPSMSRGDNESGVLWVGDLTLNCQVQVESDAGELVWELVEGPRSYRATVDVGTGNVSFSYLLYDSDGSPPEEVNLGQQPAPSPLKGRGTYQVSFANVNDRLCLWINDALVKTFEFNPEAQDQRLSPRRPVRPTERDLSPAGIAARGASAIVSHLKLERDVYYRAVSDAGPDTNDPAGAISLDIAENPGLVPEVKNLFPYRTVEELAHLQDQHNLSFARKVEFATRATLSDPERWNDRFHGYLQRLDRVFPLTDSENDAEDEFLVLGDNSPRSSDSRYWQKLAIEHKHAVPRKLLIGKAFFIYWPHAQPFLNNGKGYPISAFLQDRPLEPGRRPPKVPALSVPWYPQFGRMTRIR